MGHSHSHCWPFVLSMQMPCSCQTSKNKFICHLETFPSLCHTKRKKAKLYKCQSHPVWVRTLQVWKLPASSPSTAMLWLLTAIVHQPTTYCRCAATKDSRLTATETYGHFSHLHYYNPLRIFIFIISKYLHPCELSNACGPIISWIKPQREKKFKCILLVIYY